MSFLRKIYHHTLHIVTKTTRFVHFGLTEEIISCKERQQFLTTLYLHEICYLHMAFNV